MRSMEPIYARPREEAEIIVRNCLKCEKRFKAEGKFNRICQSCKSSRTFRAASLPVARLQTTGQKSSRRPE